MNLYWVYALPTWLFGVLTIAVFVLVGVGGMFATRSWVRGLHFEDHSHNDIVGFFLAGVTVLYGVTLGLMSVGAWTTHTDTEMKVAEEASSLAALYRDVSSYPGEIRVVLQEGLRQYAREVIDNSWPLQRKGIIPLEEPIFSTRFRRRLWRLSRPRMARRSCTRKLTGNTTDWWSSGDCACRA